MVTKRKLFVFSPRMPDEDLVGVVQSLVQMLQSTESPDSLKLRSGLEQRTALMIRRFPRNLSEEELKAKLEQVLGVDCGVTELYLPMSKPKTVNAKPRNRGFAFIRFAAPILAADFVDAFTRFGLANAELTYAHVQKNV
jgi:hypothetical protein